VEKVPDTVSPSQYAPADARRTVLAVLARLEAEDADERERGVPSEQRSRQVAPTTGRFLFALVASNAGVEVLELGGSRGYRPSGWRPARACSAGGC
jgi:predicted O-methyltransferase YrrM